jgi:branched-chain amino acid transport system ATP-binding protein
MEERMPEASRAGSQATEPLLRLRGVHMSVGPYRILHGVDLDVPAGQVTMLLGRNGAGKTSTLRTIMGLWRTSEGAITLAGQRIDALDTPAIAQAGLAYVPESMGIFADLTVAENLVLAARGARGVDDLDAARLARILDFFPALKTFWHQAAGLLSGGQKQMLAVARAMIEPRTLLLIDEPSKGLAPAIVANLTAALRQLKAEGATVLLVEQNVAMARALGDRVAVMDDGRILHHGPMDELAADTALQQRLLGLSLGGSHGVPAR